MKVNDVSEFAEDSHHEGTHSDGSDGFDDRDTQEVPVSTQDELLPQLGVQGAMPEK